MAYVDNMHAKFKEFITEWKLCSLDYTFDIVNKNIAYNVHVNWDQAPDTAWRINCEILKTFAETVPINECSLLFEIPVNENFNSQQLTELVQKIPADPPVAIYHKRYISGFYKATPKAVCKKAHFDEFAAVLAKVFPQKDPWLAVFYNSKMFTECDNWDTFDPVNSKVKYINKDFAEIKDIGDISDIGDIGGDKVIFTFDEEIWQDQYISQINFCIKATNLFNPDYQKAINELMTFAIKHKSTV